MGCVATIGGYGWPIGALLPADATNQVFPSSKITNKAGGNQQVWNQIQSSVSAGELVDANGAAEYQAGTASCAAAGGSGQSGNVKLAQMAGGLALQGINVAAVASSSIMAAIGGATILGAATMGIGAIIGLFPLLFGHHAAAVKKEQSVLCSAVPAANNYLQIIASAVQSGQATPQAAIQALSSLYSDFESAVSSILKGSIGTGTCNAACVAIAQLHAIVLEMQSEYQDQIDAANAAAAAQAAAEQESAAAQAAAAQAAAASVAAGTSQVLPASKPNTSAAAAVVPASSYASFYKQPAAAAPSTSSSWLPIAAIAVAAFLFVETL
jgi:hypothetical protein